MINQQMSSPAPKSKAWLWIVSIILVAGLVGAGVYYWQNMEAKQMAATTEEKVRNEMQAKITEAENKINELTNKLSATENKITELESIQTANNLCAAEPTPTEAGYSVYLIDTKYQNLGHLGELFTASDCNDQDRLSKIFGVKGTDYTIGANITLSNNPSANLLSTIKTIGFQCAEKTTETTCKKWQLKKTAQVNDILKLKTFYQELNGYDCINCG